MVRSTVFQACLLSLLLVVFVSLSQGQNGCSFKDFNYPGALQTTAEAVNNMNQVVGAYFDSTGTIQRAFLFRSGKFSSFSGPNGTTDTEASGINNNGQVVGRYFDSTSGHMKAFLKDSTGFHTLNIPTTGDALAEGINDAGVIVGTIDNSDGSEFAYTIISGKVTTFQNAGMNTSAHGINNSGQIVGSFDNGTGTRIGYIRATNGTFTTFSDGDQFTEPMKINKAGEAAGFAFDSAQGHTSFVYAQGTIVPISQSGTVETDVFGVNDDDVLVGGVIPAAGSHQKAFSSICTNVF